MAIIIDSYKPLPKQLEFHKSDAKYKCFVGGFGSGKTKAGIWEVIDLCVRYPRNIALIARKTATDLRDSTQRMFFEECPRDLIQTYLRAQKRVILINGSEIIFRGLDEPERQTKSLNLGVFYVDEASEIDIDTFRMLQGRLRLSYVPKHYGLLTTNPPNVDHWIYKLFVERKSKDYFLVQSSTYDNKYLPEDYVKSLEEEYPESWRYTFLQGNFGFIQKGSPVFKNVNRELHFADLSYMHGKPVYVGWDFGFVHPAIVCLQVDNDDRVCVLREYMGSNIYLNEFADKVIFLLNQWFPNAKFEHFCDPAGVQRSDKSAMTSIDILKSKGINNVRWRKIEVSVGLAAIQQKINTLIGDKPGLIIDNSCRFLKEAFLGGYCYDKNSNKNEPLKDGLYEHVCDALRYIFNVMFVSKSENLDISIPQPRWFAYE